MFVFGLSILAWVIYPLVRFQFVDSRRMSQETFITPGGEISQVITFANDNNFNENIDYTKANNWFPRLDGDSELSVDYTHYQLEIPKLNIHDADVALIGEDLSKSLVHYGGTALPGNPGNGVIFGHSILPQFYDPENYMAIFSTLHTLEDGDQILLSIDGITYQYQVNDMFEVEPEEISVLDQDYSEKSLTLITCTPPGTYLRRLVIRAELVPYENPV